MADLGGVEPSGDKLKLFECVTTAVHLSMGHLPIHRTMMDRLQSRGTKGQLRKMSLSGG